MMDRDVSHCSEIKFLTFRRDVRHFLFFSFPFAILSSYCHTHYFFIQFGLFFSFTRGASASAIIRRTEEICRQNIQLEFRWVPGHAGIEGNETADQLAKDAAAPEIEEELPSEEDRCTSLSNLRRCTTDAKRKRSDEWFEAKCKSKKYYHLDKQHKPNRTITKTEKSTAQIFCQLKVGHALIGPHLKRIKKAEDDKCWWCTRKVAQSREHLFKHCKHWRQPQNALWQAVTEASGRGKSNTSMKDLFGDRRCSEAVIQFLRSTEVGRRFRERGLEEDDPGG
jgi:hypothetical protein